MFTRWYAALRLAETGSATGAATDAGTGSEAASGAATGAGTASVTGAGTGSEAESEAEAAYRDAATRLPGSGMPGLADGLLPLALLCLRVRYGLPPRPGDPAGFGPYEPWARPLVLLAEGRREAAAAALREVPDPPRDLLLEALWCLTARAALALGDRPVMERAYAALRPAEAELAGAGSGLLTVGPVARHLDDLAVALRRP
ncbi:hypothetical protein [Actinoallomurus spadix]|uniref:SARP family transcriptional regulator n=1 Tax=Actinoallomurus spadix TaxID=79912 RepID=A0ABN0XRL3_9ACTN|nr:hypothetical protein [Actinoallomurus spadix]